MAEKETTMVLEVNLQCYRCYKKVKKILCKFPQVRDQKYDEKANKVTITVVSNCPEKIKDKIYSRGGGCIKCIEIKPPPKPKEPEKKPKESEKKPKESESVKKSEKPKTPEPAPPPPMAYPPIGCFCIVCHGGGPCHFGGAPPPPCYVTYGRPVYDSWGGGGGYKYRYLCEENPQACSIM